MEQRAHYLRELLRRYGMLSLPLGSGLNFSLIQVFQPLRLRQSVMEARQHSTYQSEEHERNEEKGETEKRGDPREVLAENGIEALSKSPRGRLIILGGPGSGKTTVLKHLLCHQASLALEEPSALLPIFLSLPDLARAGQDLDAYLAHLASDLDLDTDAGRMLTRVIRQGCAFVCLDSLDEVLPRLRAGIIHQINELAQQSGNTWAIGSRFTDYKGGQFQQGQFQEWELQTLDEPRRVRLAEQLLPELQRQLPTSTTQTSTLIPRQYVQALSEHPQAASWGENPLLFSLGAVVYLRQRTLSGSRSMLYHEVIEALLETRESDSLQRAFLRELLADLALELYQMKGRTFSLDDMRALLLHFNHEQRATWSIEEMRYRLLNSGLFEAMTGETYTFRHQTFQEYLVASALARHFTSDDEQIRNEAHQLAWSKHTYSRWNEIERLLVGILVQEYEQEGMHQAISWLARLLRQQESPEGDPGHLSLELALKVLGEVAELPAWQNEETQTLEEEAATVWAKLVATPSTVKLSQRRGETYHQRLWPLASEIGRLLPATQEKALQPLVKLFLRGNELAPLLGLTCSRVVAEHLRAAWLADPAHWVQIASPFTAGLQAYAPVDLVLPKLRDGSSYEINEATRFLRGLGRFAPIPELITLLQGPREETRSAAAEILMTVAKGVEIPVDALLPLWQPDAPGAFDIARVLACLRHPAGIELLQASLRDPHWQRRQSALEVLAHLGTQVSVEAIAACLRDPMGHIRTTALNMLGAFGPRAPLMQLIEALHDPEDGTTLAAAMRALLRIVSSTPLTLLLAALDHTDEPGMAIARPAPVGQVLADQALTEAMLAFTADEARLQQERKTARFSGYIRQEIIKTLSRLARHLPAPVVLSSLNEAKDRDLQAAYAPGESAVPSLAALTDLSDHVWTAREVAVHILALDGAEKQLAPLLTALRDRESKVSWAARLQLLKVADCIPLERLLEALHDPQPWVRRHALDLLAKHPEQPEREPLLAALHDADPSVREAAATVFSTWTESAPLEELVEATYDEYVNVRLAAASALGQAGLRHPALAQEGILNTLLQPGINDPDQVGMLALALQRNSLHAPSEPLLNAMYALYNRSKNWLAGTVAEAIATQGERMPVAELRKALFAADRGKRRLACIALGGAGAAAPIQELIELFDCPEKDENILYDVIGALNALWEHVPATIFLRILRDEKSRESRGVQSLAALIRKGEQLPEDILSWALSTFSFENQQQLAAYLATLDELPSLPYEVLLVGLTKAMPYAPADVPHVNKAAINVLVPRFPLAALQAMLQHEDARIRRGVLLLLTYHPEEMPQEALIALLNGPLSSHMQVYDSDAEVCRAAIARLRRHSDLIPVQALLKLLRNPHVGCDALRALGKAGEHAPLSQIMPFLNSSNAAFRTAALHALRQPGLLERAPTETFLKATGDADLSVRTEALKALKEKDQQLAVTYCLMELGDAFVFQQSSSQIAFQILQEIAPNVVPEIVQEASELVQGNKPGRFFRSVSLSFLADTIGAMDRATPELLARLGELLDWPYWQVRMRASQALGKLRRNIPDAAIRRLLELRHDPHSRAVREAADEALAEILSLETGIEDD